MDDKDGEVVCESRPLRPGIESFNSEGSLRTKETKEGWVNRFCFDNF